MAQNLGTKSKISDFTSMTVRKLLDMIRGSLDTCGYCPVIDSPSLLTSSKKRNKVEPGTRLWKSREQHSRQMDYGSGDSEAGANSKTFRKQQ
jgi:hypothetical protein